MVTTGVISRLRSKPLNERNRLIETVDVCSAAYRGTAESSFRRSSLKFVVAGERGQNARVHFTPR
jgi:hypothetical protein